jgi:hypothetical protein
MSATRKKPLNRKLAIFLAVIIMWLVGGIGLVIMHSIHPWNFLLLDGYDVGTLGQIGGYYLARVGTQVPALGFAAIIIGRSDFRHPIRTACLTAFAYQGIMTAIRLVKQPLAVAPDLDQSIPVFAEVAQLFLMVVFIGFFTWFFVRLHTWLDTGPLARYFHR